MSNWKFASFRFIRTPYIATVPMRFNTLRPRQDGRHFTDDSFKRIFLNENFMISIKILLTFVPKGPVNNILALVQIMAWHRPGDKPLSEPMMSQVADANMRHAATMSFDTNYSN